MKSQEAQKYLCPQAMAGGRDEACKGKDCAAWRWAEPKWGSVDQRRGFCGLAGDAKFPLNPDNEHPG
jgi:hypothetical protein